MPERLVVVATFKMPQVAREAVAGLQAEGIYAETGSGFARGRSQHQVRVFESDVERATALLTPLVGEEQRDEAIVCPRCSSRRIAARPPMPLLVIAAGVASTVVLAASKHGVIAAGVLLASGVAAAFVEHVVGRWRCENCQHVWVR